ncbi:hypothetical protein VE03_03938 [Pseudogymnoascus sp. 23342-1-I1]|nr:hypothetical protein VE03_03938 [Pseudogymnoascus sp. 23342-1-I1]
MIAVTRQLQAVMATTAMIWFILYEPASMNAQLSVTIALFTLSTSSFILRHHPDITSYCVLPTFSLLILSPILWDCSPFQDRHIVAVIPLFLCAVLFFAVELARGAKALERLADHRRQGYLNFGDDPRTPTLVEDGTTEASWRPRRSPGSIALETEYAEQAAPLHSGRNRVRSPDSLQLSTSSISARESVVGLVDSIGGFFANETITYTLPRERGPYYPSCYGSRCCNYMPEADPGEYQSDPEEQSELDEHQLDLDERRQPEVW